jgi:hypothetical protein
MSVRTKLIRAYTYNFANVSRGPQGVREADAAAYRQSVATCVAAATDKGLDQPPSGTVGVAGAVCAGAGDGVAGCVEEPLGAGVESAGADGDAGAAGAGA